MAWNAPGFGQPVAPFGQSYSYSHPAGGSQGRGSPCGSIFIGLLLLVFSLWLVFWNETGAVTVAQTLDEGLNRVVPLYSLPSAESAGKHDGQLVHLVDTLKVEEVSDSTFGIRVKALRLKRRVKMFQCIETRRDHKQEVRDQSGNVRVETITEYHYSGGWSESLHDSRNYRYPERCGMPGEQYNPPSFPFSSADFVSASVRMGPFEVSAPLHSQIHDSRQLDLHGPALIGSEQASDARSREVALTKGLPRGCELVGSEIRMVKKQPNGPHLGDIIITFDVTLPATYSMIAEVRGGHLVPYHAKAGRDIAMVSAGTVSADEMFHRAHESNRVMTWVIRGLASFLIFLGYRMTLEPIPMILGMIPLIGPLAGVIASTGVTIVSLVLAAATASITISVAWLAARPVMSVTLIAGAIIGVYILMSRKRQAGRRAD